MSARGPKVPSAGQGATWASRPARSALETEKDEAREIHPQGGAAFPGGRQGGYSPAALLGPPPALRGAAPPRAGPSGGAGLLLVVGGHRKTRRSAPQRERPSPPESGLRPRGPRTRLASTPAQARRVLKPAEPATGPPRHWGTLTAVATGLSEQLAGFWPWPPDGEATKRTSQPRGAAATARAKGLRAGRRPWRGTRPGRRRFASASRSPHRGLCVRDPRSVSRASPGRGEPARGCRRRGRRPAERSGEGARKRAARPRPPGVRAGLRTAPRSAPPLRPPEPLSPAAEQCAPGRGAPAISGAARRGGEGRGWGCCERHREREGGSARRQPSERGERRRRRELEKSVSGELIGKGSGGGALRRVETKRTPCLSH